jgi:hypothetical protein
MGVKVNVYITNWKDPPCYSWVNPRTKSPFSIAIYVSLPEGTMQQAANV